MLSISNNVEQYWAFFLFFFTTIGLCSLILLSSFFLGGKSKVLAQHIPFESGINSVGTTNMRLSVKFYLVAMFFVIFDVESLYLYSWSVSVKETGWIGFIEAAVFIFTLISSLIYLTRIHVLNWTKVYFIK
ncbi:NAD(P)H-quinone oxidoreductase subunit 3, chloroplastic [Candidatus Ecksteinia adelgidicola]|nr:NAD(P)H-quinone oxidoreductase subunit 3, chloroplastic [Candidatus Ecksteinia adelgidicola]